MPSLLERIIRAWSQSHIPTLTVALLVWFYTLFLQTHGFHDSWQISSYLLLPLSTGIAVLLRRQYFPYALALSVSLIILACLVSDPSIYLLTLIIVAMSGVQRQPTITALNTALISLLTTIATAFYWQSKLAPNQYKNFLIPMLTTLIIGLGMALVVRLYLRLQTQTNTNNDLRQDLDIQKREYSSVLEAAQLAGILHDSVGHDLTAIIALSESLATTIKDEKALTILEAITEHGHNGLIQTRNLIRVIDQQAPLTERIYGNTDIISKVKAFELFGINTHFEDRSDSTPATYDLIYRIINESLTNILKHGCEVTDVFITFESLPHSITQVTIYDNGILNTPKQEKSLQSPLPVFNTFLNLSSLNTNHSPLSGSGLVRLAKQVKKQQGKMNWGLTEQGWQVQAQIPNCCEYIRTSEMQGDNE